MPHVNSLIRGGVLASSGEAILVAFRGREHTRTFGIASYGVPTANKGYPLGDGATLVVAGSYFADRKGRIYSGPGSRRHRLILAGAS